MENIQFQDYLAFSRLVFEWAESADRKDWDRLRSILAPTLMVDYRIVGLRHCPQMASEEFISMINAPEFAGDPLIQTQHLMGAVDYEPESDTEIVATHQMRVSQLRYADLDLNKVAHRCHCYGTMKHWYKKIDGVWKLAGMCPEIQWNEGDFDKMFPGISGEN